MPADPRDDFAVFADREHMFYGLVDPYAAFRGELVEQLCAQVPDTVVESIAAFDEPKWLTIGRRLDDGSKLVVAYWGVCFRARVAVAYGYGTEQLTAALTFLFGRWDDPAEQRVRTYFDLGDDAERGFTAERFEQRFLAFRADDP
ncbi:MAG: hypothetical protein ABI867_03895 [Kofleriaceae bacterium]